MFVKNLTFFYFREEAARMWEKREAEWEKERRARERLMKEVTRSALKAFKQWSSKFPKILNTFWCSCFLKYLLTGKHCKPWSGRPLWLSWMRHPTGDQEVAGSTPAEIGNILSWRLIVKYFLRSFSPFSWFMKGSCQFLVKECAQYWLIA